MGAVLSSWWPLGARLGTRPSQMQKGCRARGAARASGWFNDLRSQDILRFQDSGVPAWRAVTAAPGRRPSPLPGSGCAPPGLGAPHDRPLPLVPSPSPWRLQGTLSPFPRSAWEQAKITFSNSLCRNRKLPRCLTQHLKEGT